MNPNLFIVGAPKCGTSALHDYLAQHPDVYMSEPKEPHHFCTDVDAPYAIRDDGAYRALFDKAHARVIGESSATYLYSRVAAAKIHQTYPEARIIAMFRNPLEMLPSLHSQKLVNGTEEIADFAEALAAEAQRKAGALPARGAFPFYRDAARYSEQLERYLDLFPRERLHIVIFDDFKRDVTGVYRGVLEFLGLPSFTPNFKVRNRNKRVRSRAVLDHLQNPHSLVNRLPKPLNTLTYKTLDKLNSAHAPRTPLSPALKAHLQEEFKDEVERLSELLGRNLRGWVR